MADPSVVADAWVREESMINSSPGAREALAAVTTFLNEGTNVDLQADALNAARWADRILLVWGVEHSLYPVGDGTGGARETAMVASG